MKLNSKSQKLNLTITIMFVVFAVVAFFTKDTFNIVSSLSLAAVSLLNLINDKKLFKIVMLEHILLLVAVIFYILNNRFNTFFYIYLFIFIALMINSITYIYKQVKLKKR